MGRLQCRNDAFKLAAQLERRKGFLVGGRDIFHSAHVMQPGVFRPDARIIQPCRNRMAFSNLAIIIHQQISPIAMQYSRLATRDRSGMLLFQTVSCRLNANDLDVPVIEEGMEQAHGIGATANCRNQRVRQTAFALQHLLPGFASDHRLKIPHHFRIGRRACHCANAIKGVFNIRHPIAQGFIESILQRARTRLCWNNRSTQQLHPEHIWHLSGDINLAHIDDTFEAKPCAGRGRCHAMLASPSFGDNPLLAHATGQQDLPHDIVDLVGTGMIQFIAFEINLGTLQIIGQAFGKIQR